MTVRRAFTVVFACLMMVFLVGCPKSGTTGKKKSDYRQERQKLLAKAQSGKLNKKPAVKKPVATADDGTDEVAGDNADETAGMGFDESFEYKIGLKRDPFRSFVLDTSGTIGGETPLETFDLFQLDLVAVIWGSDNRRGMVLDPSGRPYIVQEGSRIGKNLGQVVSIEDDIIWVEETYIDPLGNRTLKTVELRLYPDQGG